MRSWKNDHPSLRVADERREELRKGSRRGTATGDRSLDGAEPSRATRSAKRLANREAKMTDFDPRDDSVWLDPDGAFRHLREADPVHWSAAENAWILTRHAEAAAVLRNPDTFSSDPSHACGRPAEVLSRAAQSSPLSYRTLLSMLDGEPHSRLRTLVATHYSPQHVERFREPIRDLSVGLLSDKVVSGSFDVVGDYARPLFQAAALLPLGVSGPAAMAFLESAEFLIGVTQAGVGAQVQTASDEARREAQGQLGTLLAAGPGAGALKDMQAARDRGELADEQFSNLALFLAGVGQGPSTLAMGSAVLALLRNEEQARAVRATPALVRGVLDETLRFASPIGVLRRFATTDAIVGRNRVRAGQVLEVVVPAVNRDPSVFAEPHRFNVRRSSRSHFGFGRGAHRCLGAALARVSFEEALSALLSRIRVLGAGDRIDLLTGELAGPVRLDLTDSSGIAGRTTGVESASVAVVPRNHACPCGSGRKYKQCHGGS